MMNKFIIEFLVFAAAVAIVLSGVPWSPLDGSCGGSCSSDQTCCNGICHQDRCTCCKDNCYLPEGSKCCNVSGACPPANTCCEKEDAYWCCDEDSVCCPHLWTCCPTAVGCGEHDCGVGYQSNNVPAWAKPPRKTRT